MDNNSWNELYSAAKSVLNPRKISERMEAGGVAAAIESDDELRRKKNCRLRRAHPTVVDMKGNFYTR